MRKRGLGAIVGCVAVLSMIAVQPAGAATQVGNSCAGNAPGPNFSLIGLTNGPGNPFPATMPSSGVVTRWSSNIALEFPSGLLTGALKVLRPTGAPKLFQVVGESSGLLATGSSSFTSRVPVQAGDHIGFVSWATADPTTIVTLFCSTGNPGDSAGVFSGNPPSGSTAAVVDQGAGVQVPIIATLEPDADNDGFGDETQDQCPQTPLVQGICPTVAVDASTVLKRKGSVVVLLTTDASAPVKVTGIAKLGKGEKAKLSSKTQTVVPGKVSRFTLNFPRKLKKKLAALAKKRSLQLKLTASATDLIGQVTTDTLKTRLKGQAKPAKGQK